MTNEQAKVAKKNATFALTPKQIAVLDQLHAESGMNKSEIIGKLIVDYQSSIRKQICP
jgi:hypothetical protein